jgi:hypothetical protein
VGITARAARQRFAPAVGEPAHPRRTRPEVVDRSLDEGVTDLAEPTRLERHTGSAIDRLGKRAV